MAAAVRAAWAASASRSAEGEARVSGGGMVKEDGTDHLPVVSQAEKMPGWGPGGGAGGLSACFGSIKKKCTCVQSRVSEAMFWT